MRQRCVTRRALSISATVVLPPTALASTYGSTALSVQSAAQVRHRRRTCLTRCPAPRGTGRTSLEGLRSEGDPHVPGPDPCSSSPLGRTRDVVEDEPNGDLGVGP